MQAAGIQGGPDVGGGPHYLQQFDQALLRNGQGVGVAQKNGVAVGKSGAQKRHHPVDVPAEFVRVANHEGLIAIKCAEGAAVVGAAVGSLEHQGPVLIRRQYWHVSIDLVKLAGAVLQMFIGISCDPAENGRRFRAALPASPIFQQ